MKCVRYRVGTLGKGVRFVLVSGGRCRGLLTVGGYVPFTVFVPLAYMYMYLAVLCYQY